MPTPVPCNGCTACCKGDVVWMQPGDDPTLYKLRAWNGRLALDVKPNGDCVYLGPKGCTIQQTKPLRCKEFDCRVMYASKTKAERREHIVRWPAVRAAYDAGRSRLKTLDAPAL